MSVLIYSPTWHDDEALVRANRLAAITFEDLQAKGVAVTPLIGTSATPASFFENLPRLRGVLVVTHGNEGSISLSETEAISESNLAVLCGKWVHAVACLTASSPWGLAQKAIGAGAVGYAGYSYKLILEYQAIPQDVERVFASMLSTVSIFLDTHVNDRLLPQLKRELSRLADKVVNWTNDNPGLSSGIEILAQQLASRLVVIFADSVES